MSNTEIVPAEDEVEMQEIHDFDFDRAMVLMSVIEKVANTGVKNTSISGLAQAELEAMNIAAKEIAVRRADRAREAEAKRVQVEQERLDREAAENDADHDGIDDRPDRGNRRDYGGSSNIRPDQVPRSIPSNKVAPVPRPGEPSPNNRRV